MREISNLTNPKSNCCVVYSQIAGITLNFHQLVAKQVYTGKQTAAVLYASLCPVKTQDILSLCCHTLWFRFFCETSLVLKMVLLNFRNIQFPNLLLFFFSIRCVVRFIVESGHPEERRLQRHSRNANRYTQCLLAGYM